MGTFIGRSRDGKLHGSGLRVPGNASVSRQGRLELVPKQWRKFYQLAWSKLSRRGAIRAFCLECMSFDVSSVGGCPNEACPLYEYRKRG